MIRIVVVACALSCLAAPAWTQTQPAPGTPATQPAAKKPAPKARAAAKKPAPESGPCQLGVIPLIGDEFVVQKVGMTLFGNERTEVPVNGWGLDEFVVARVRAAAPGLAVRKITVAKDAFTPPAQPTGSFFRDRKAELSAAVQQAVAGSSCERYVLVQKTDSPFSSTNQSVRGIGIVNWASLSYRTYLFALTHIRIFDGGDFSLIKQGDASVDDESPLSTLMMAGPVRGPNRKVDEFPANPADAATNASYRDGVRALLAASLDKSLPALLAP
jgi:hypothetical protein